MICDKVVDLVVEICENLRRSRDKCRLVAVAASEVLRSYDRHGFSGIGVYQQNLAVVVGKICALYNLGDERPKFERLVGGLMVEHKIDARHFICTADKEKSAQKFFGDRKRCLPNLCGADLA